MSVEVFQPATADDLRFLALHMRAADRVEIMATQPDGMTAEGLIERAAGFAARGPQLVHKIDGEPIAVQGAVEMWPRVWSCYAWGTDRWSEAVLSLTKASKRVILPIMQKAGAHRAQAVSLGIHTSAHSWLEMLGFHREGVLRGFGRNGEDFVTFALDPKETPIHVLRQHPGR